MKINMFKIMALTLTAVVLLITASLAAFAEEKSASIESVISQIREEQKVGSNKDINPDLVSDDFLEKLGDAVMAHPDERQHEWMDSMMGGEGSESLRRARIRMGYNYLIHSLGNSERYSDGMMGGGMMGGRDNPPFLHNRGYQDMGMHFGYFSPGGWAMGIGIIVIVGLLIFIIFQNSKRRDYKTAEEILKIRLAKGEINKDEFIEIKKHL